jgi:hypothetical protein
MNFCTLTTVINGRELKYDIETGLIWCANKTSGKWKVKPSYKNNEYRRLTVGRKNYYIHRVIYKFYNPEWNIDDASVQNNSIDHINGTKTDNYITNLRNLTNQQNHFNQTNAKGYYWCVNSNKWKAAICLNGKNIHLGMFNLEEDARNAYLEAKKVYHIITPILCTGS